MHQLRQSVAAYRGRGAMWGLPYFLSLVATAEGAHGQAGGLATMAEALVVAEQTGELSYAAELYRVQGELTLQRSCDQCRGSRSPTHCTPQNHRQKVSAPKPQVPPVQRLGSDAEASFLRALALAQCQ